MRPRAACLSRSPRPSCAACRIQRPPIRSPYLELDLFTTTIDAAVSRANRGDIAGGHDELLYGLERTVAAQQDGEAWGAELVGHWNRALERYAERWRMQEGVSRVSSHSRSARAPFFA